jgi:hypothetical protein
MTRRTRVLRSTTAAKGFSEAGMLVAMHGRSLPEDWGMSSFVVDRDTKWKSPV